MAIRKFWGVQKGLVAAVFDLLKRFLCFSFFTNDVGTGTTDHQVSNIGQKSPPDSQKSGGDFNNIFSPMECF
jgi:hypothetical protein